jgi:hypothetical protein
VGSKQVKNINNLQAGQLPVHEARNPGSARYSNGLIEATGARFIGGRVTHANGTTPPENHLFKNDFVPYPDGKTYLRNTDKSPADTTSALTADLPATGIAESLNDKISRMINGQLHLSKTGIADNAYNQTGKYNKFDIGLTNANARLVSSTGDIIYVSKDIRYCRAIIYTEPTDVTQYWTTLGTKKFWKSEVDYLLGGVTLDRQQDDTGSKPITICNGKEAISDYTEIYHDIVFYSNLRASINISPIIYTIKKGWYKPTASTSLYLVGKMKMFSGSPKDPRRYAYTAGEINDTQLSDVSVNTDNSRQDQIGMDDVYVMRWSVAGTEDQIDYNLDDSDVQALNVPYAWTSQPPGATAKTFFFSTARNKVVRLRRCGVAQFVDNTGTSQATTGERDFYVGFTKLAVGAGDGNVRTVGGSAGDAYLATLGEKPLWVEPGYQGVFAGTEEAEYLISNEQSTTSFTVQKIASIGSGSATTDYCDAATTLYGNIYFITKRGVARLQFSTERNSYIPVITDIVDMGFSKPLSIASSKELNCIILFCEDGRFVQIAPDTGAVSVVRFASPSTSVDLYSPVGVCTESGEVKFVWVSGTTYRQTFLSRNTVSATNLRTTFFGAFPESYTKINKVFIALSDSFGGRVKASSQIEWQDIEYTGEEIQARNFTGIKQLYLRDFVANESEGRGIDISFEADENMNIAYVAVEGEV